MNFFSLLLGKQYNVLAYLPEAVMVIDETGRIYYANKQAFKLFETNRLRGKNINDYFITNSDNIIKNKDEQTKQILKIVSEEQNTKITDVKVVDVTSGKNKRYILSVIDNTQDHSLLDQLITERQEQKILNHTKNVLLSKMSNYLRSPLHSVIGFSQAMLEGLSGDINDKQRKYLKIMNSNAYELLILIDKLIEMSQVESDLYKCEYNNFDITSLVSIILNEASVKLNYKDIKISTNSSELITPNCFSDKNILKMVITNLLANAIDSIQTGAITINILNPSYELLSAKGFDINENTGGKSYLFFEISAKGINAAQYNNEELFDPYIQVDKNSKKFLFQSLLLGSSKKYISKLNGTIWTDSQFSNQVSFAFIIPVEKTIIEKQPAEVNG